MPSNVRDPSNSRGDMPTVEAETLAKPAESCITILGIRVAALERQDALDRVAGLVDAPTPALVAFANAHTLNVSVGDTRFREALNGASLVLNDGVGVQIAAALQGRRFPENLNGTDFLPRLLALAAERRWRVFFLGGRPGVAAAAAASAERDAPGLEVCGTRHGFFDSAESARVAEEIRTSGSDLVLVGMGNPRQELWLVDWLGASGARLGVGVGAFLDFKAETVRRAPSWMNRAGLEWLFRLAQEPQRLAARYLVGMPIFLARALRDARTSRRLNRASGRARA
jgi:exopolysaccharide biosynthesis WecB/TagA/CpsF family protein